jgi:hypothetical protein
MGRLPSFDYKRPYFYMVTLKRASKVLHSGAPAPLSPPGNTIPFCTISPDGHVLPNAVTTAFEAEIASWASFWRSVESVSPHVVMPDHLHLLVKLAAVEKAVSLPVLIGDLRKRLNRAYRAVVAADAAPGTTIFAPDWHDWIVKKEGQLPAFRRYILENPERHARRQANRRFFTQAREIVFGGKRFWAYGNEALLELPMLVAVKGHRRPWAEPSPAPPSKTREALLAAAARIGPGGAGLSTFLSPLEKEAGNAIVMAGGSLILLSMQGFAPRWHPPEKQELLCAAGRLLCLSPYAPQSAKLSKKDMHDRAHALADWALEHSHAQLEAWPEEQGGTRAESRE